MPTRVWRGGIVTMHFYRNSSKVIASDIGDRNLFELKEIEKGSKILSSKNVDNIKNVEGGNYKFEKLK